LGFGFRVWVWGLEFAFGVRVWVWGLEFGFGVWGLGLGFGFGVWGLGLGFGVSRVACLVPHIGSKSATPVLGLGFGVAGWGLGLGACGLEFGSQLCFGYTSNLAKLKWP